MISILIGIYDLSYEIYQPQYNPPDFCQLNRWGFWITPKSWVFDGMWSTSSTHPRLFLRHRPLQSFGVVCGVFLPCFCEMDTYEGMFLGISLKNNGISWEIYLLNIEDRGLWRPWISTEGNLFGLLGHGRCYVFFAIRFIETGRPLVKEHHDAAWCCIWNSGQVLPAIPMSYILQDHMDNGGDPKIRGKVRSECGCTRQEQQIPSSKAPISGMNNEYSIWSLSNSGPLRWFTPLTMVYSRESVESYILNIKWNKSSDRGVLMIRYG